MLLHMTTPSHPAETRLAMQQGAGIGLPEHVAILSALMIRLIVTIYCLFSLFSVCCDHSRCHLFDELLEIRRPSNVLISCNIVYQNIHAD